MNTFEIGTALLSVVSGIAWIVTQFNTISTLKEKSREMEIKFNDRIKEIESKLIVLEANRNKDILDFTRMLGEINITLTRFNGTLQNFNETLKEVKEVVKEHDEHIRKNLT